MNQCKLTAWISIASFLFPSIGFTTIQTTELAIATPVKISKATNRKPFYSKAGRFLIDFPSEPTAITGKNEANGEPVYTFNLGLNQKSFYQALYSDVSALKDLSREEIRKLLIGVPTGFAQGLQAQVTDIKSIQIGKNNGLEFTFERSGQIIGRGRVYRVGKERIYMMTSIGNSAQATSSFLNSFRLR